RPVKHPRDHAVLALIDRARRALAAHRAVHRLDRELAGMRRRVRLPARDLALARLAGGEADMHRLLHGLVDHLLLQAEQRADSRRLRRAQMADMIDLVLVQADRAYEVDLDLVAGRDAADQL